jgi:hypothetical protein
MLIARILLLLSLLAPTLGLTSIAHSCCDDDTCLQVNCDTSFCLSGNVQPALTTQKVVFYSPKFSKYKQLEPLDLFHPGGMHDIWKPPKSSRV